jgi:hypothetical protein
MTPPQATTKIKWREWREWCEWRDWREWREWRNGRKRMAEWQNGINGYIRTIYGTRRRRRHRH